MTPEAISNYLTFGAGVVVAFIGWTTNRYLNRKKPRIVRVNKIAEQSLIEIAPEFKDQLKVLFDKREIDSFYQTQLQIHNSSDERVDDVSIEIHFDEAEYLDVAIEDTILDRKTPKDGRIVDDKFSLSLPYLNSEEYKDRVTISILSQKPISIKQVAGGGRDWMIKYSDIVELQLNLEKNTELVDLGSGIFRLSYSLVDYTLRAVPLALEIRRSRN